MAFTPIDEEEIIDEPVAEEAKPRFIPIEDDEFFGIGGEERPPEPVTTPEAAEPVEAPKSRFTPISEEEFFGLPEPTEPIPVTGEEGLLRQAADIPLKIGESINTSLRALTDLFGADNAVSQNLTQNAEWYRSLLSAQALEDEQEVGRILQEAENEGVLDQLGAGLEAFSVAPVDFVASGIGSLATFAATGVAGRAAALAGAARAGLTGARAAQFVQRGVQATQLATGAGMGAGIVKGEIYQSVKDEMLAQGKTEEEAKGIAMDAQSYMGKNLDQILLGAGLGTIDAFTGAEKIIGKVLTKGGLKPDASRIGNILKNGITEAAPEFIQAAQEKFASNLALQREGVDVSLTQGVFSQGALEGLVGLGMGVGAGAIEPRIQTEPTKEEVSAAAAETQDVARRSMDVAPATASLVEGEAEQIIQSQAETPEQRVARLEREAQEAAGIELEEEPPVSGLPPVEPTPPVTPTPEAAVAPVEPVVPEGGARPATPEIEAIEGESELRKFVRENAETIEDFELVDITRGEGDAAAKDLASSLISERAKQRLKTRIDEGKTALLTQTPEGDIFANSSNDESFNLKLDLLPEERRALSAANADREFAETTEEVANANAAIQEAVRPAVERVVAGPVVAAEGAVEPAVTEVAPVEPTVERPAEPPVDMSVTILNYDEKAQPIQDQIDNRIDELVGGGMSFEDANNDPSVTTLLDRRLAMDRGAINSYREIVNTAFTEQGVTQNDLTINPAQAIIENVYAAPRAGDEGLIASVAERGQEAFDDDAATVRKLSEAIFKYRAEAEGMTPEELLGPNSGLTEEGKQARVDEARISAETIHNQIKNSLLEQAQAQPPEALALPPVTPTPVTPPPVTPEVPTAAEPPALAPLRRVVKAEQTEDDVSGLVGQGLVELYNGQPVITQAGLEALPEAERPRLTPEARKIQIDTRTSEPAAEAISKNLRIGVDQVPVDVKMPAGWTIEGDIYIPPVVEAAPEAAARPKVTPEERRAKLDRLKEIRDEVMAMPMQQVAGYAEGLSGLTTEEAKKYSALMMEADGIRFDIRKELDVAKIPTEKERDSAVPAPIVKIASDELVADRGVFDAIAEAAAGTFFGQDTAVDKVMNGENPNVSPIQLYNSFNNTREALREKFGDTIKLYRAVGKQKEKATQNWHSTKKGALQYGKKVVSKDVPIDDIVALNVGSTGRYEEFIVGKKPAPQPEARESRRAVTPQQDRDYLDAVERGDLDAASRVVEDAAKKAGFTQRWFHGTAAKAFNVFRDFGRNFIYFTQDRGDAMDWAKSNIEYARPEYAQGETPTPRVVEAFINADNIFNRTNEEHMNRVVDLMSKSDDRSVKNQTPQQLKESLLEENYEWYEEVAYKFIRQAGFDGAYIFESQDFDPYNLEEADLGILNPNLIKSAEPVTRDDQGNPIPLSQRFQQGEADIRYARGQAGVGMTTDGVRARLEALGFGVEGMIRIVEDPQAAFEGRTIIQDGKAVRIELNASALRDNAAIDRVLNHEFAEAANADGALNKLVERLTPKEKKEINDAITRLGYEERVRTTEEAARAIETLAAGWKGRGFFERAVARVEAWGSKLGLKLTRRAAEYIAARNLSDINAGFKAAYNRFINVRGEAREGRAFVTPEENARFLELAKDPEANREELQRMVDEAARRAGYTMQNVYHASYENFDEFLTRAEQAERDGESFDWDETSMGNLGEGFYFTPDLQYAKRFGNPRKFHLKISNIVDSRIDEVMEKGRQIQQELIEDNGGTTQGEIYEELMREMGADGAIAEGAGGLSYGSIEVLIKQSNQAKLADPVTYDDQGNVIPLDQRFQPATADIRYSRTEIRESRRETAQTFTEESPEAKTLSTMRATMEKVDAASETKGGKPETQKVSEIAANWMESGGDERALQDAITENTNLSPANAAKVAKVIAKQYDKQQQIAEAVLETEAGVTLEGLPEGMEIPKDVDPKNKRTVLQRVIDATTGVRVKPVILQVPEKTALKEQIRLKARETREAKKAQQETADAVVEAIKALELRGPMRAKQAQALAKRAAKVLWTSEKSMENFIAYAERVMANTNYDADLREAKAAQKRAKELSKRDSIAAPQRETLEAIGNIGINLLNDPREFADVVNHYLRSFKPVVSEAYVVVPDAEMKSYLAAAEDVVNDAKAEFEVEDNERLADKYGITIDELKKYMDAEEIMEALTRYAKREVIEGILNEKSANVKDALKGVDTTILRVDQRKLIDSMKVIDVKSLDAAEKQAYIRIGNNIIFNNNQTNGAEFFVATAKGQQAARDLAKNTEAMTKNKAWSNIVPALGSRRAKKVLKAWAEDLQSVADTFRNAFGKEAMTVFYEAMGMVDLDLGFTNAARTLEEIQSKMEKFYKKLDKKYKGAATNQDGILSEGIVGYLIQNVPEKGEADSLAQRRGLLQQDIIERRKSGDEDRMQMADRIQELMQKLDGETVDQILANLKREYPANYESLTWLKDELFPQYKDFLKQFDENFNDQANNYNTPNYLPIVYSNISPSIDLLQGKKKYYDSLSSAPKQSSYTIKRSDYTQLPLGDDGRKPKEIGLNLRRNAYNSLSDQITRAYTNPARQRIYSFLKTPESEEALGGAANRDFFAERIERLMESRERRGSFNKNTFEKAVDVLANLGRDIGTRIALAGSYQLIRQPADQVTVAIGVTGRADLMAKHLDPRQIKAARPVIDLFSIGRRGDASSGYKYINQMEGAQSRLERYYTEGNWVKAKEAAKNFADKFMAPLKVSDFTVAAATWMTFYRAYLAKNGIKFTTWEDAANLIKSDDVGHKRAAAYAENMTDIYQGSSDPTKMAVFAQKGKTGPENLLKAILVPFNSFGVQFRSRISSELTEIFTRSGDWKGKAVAVKDLGATIGGTIMFGLAKRFVLPAITLGGVNILYSIFGVDVEEPDEEKKKEEFELKWRQLQGDIVSTMIVGGGGQMLESYTIDGMNYLKYMIDSANGSEDVLDDNGEVMSFNKYAKERAPFYRYRSFDNAMSLGILDIGMDQAKKSILNTKMVLTPEEMDKYTPEEQRFLLVALISDWLYLGGFNDADFARMWDKGRRDMMSAAKEREKELQRIRSGR